MRKSPSTPRTAFTLIELMVVMTLLLVLAGLALLVIPKVNDDQRATKSAAQLQQWVEIAKQRALRDRANRGVRLLAGSANPVQVTDLTFIEQPDDYYLGVQYVADTASGIPGQKKPLYSRASVSGVVVTFTLYDPKLGANVTTPPLQRTLIGSAALGATADYPVQPGDAIEFGGGGLVYRIQSVDGPTQLTLTNKAPTQVVTNYRIIRQPRPVGDEPLQLYQGVAIDLNPRGLGYDLLSQPQPPTIPPFAAQFPLDIMFAPDGRVIGPLAGNDKLILWVRDITVPDGDGDPTLVCVYTRTGLTGAYPVDTPNLTTSPYTFTNSGRRLAD